MRFDDLDFKRRYKKHPLLSQFEQILPNNIKELFDWMDFILFNNPIAAAGVRKLSEVPITSLQYSDTQDKGEGTNENKHGWKSILENDLSIKSTLLNISYNTLAYGNCFVSVYSPIDRRCTCKKCRITVSMENLEKVKFKVVKDENPYRDLAEKESSGYKNKDDSTLLKSKKKKKKSNLKVEAMCPTCKVVREFSTEDKKVKDITRTNIIVWNPHDIEISSNPVSGHKDFFYIIPQNIKKRVTENEPELMRTLPMPMIEAALTNKAFKFAKGHILHVQKELTSGISTAWSLPLLSAGIPSFLMLLVLRKANEKIASDYMVPLRVIYPQQTGVGSEIYNFMGGSDFSSKINGMLQKWKLDPSGVQTTPFPINVETILGDGKMLTLHQEIDQLESNIANAIGIPIEFIKGGLSYTTQGSSLRLLENQIEKVSASLNSVIAFIVSRIGGILDKEPIPIKMLPFKLIDDMQEKAAIIQLASAGNGTISRSTLLELFNFDAKAEAEKIVADQKTDIVNNLKVQQYQQEETQSLEEQANNKAMMNNGSFDRLNQQALMQEAQGYVDQLMQVDDGQRKSKLDELAKTNYILYSTVKALYDMNQGKADYQAMVQGRQQQEQQQ